MHHTSAPPFRQAGIHTLPVELLTSVFVLGSGLGDLYGESPFLLKPDQEYRPTAWTNFQVTVSHVCRHWRQVALRTQTLWTTLHFRAPSHLERARTYISRCSPESVYAFDILVDTVSREEHFPGVTLYKEDLRRIFELIVPEVQRWGAFHLKVCDNECKGIARQFLSSCGPAPRLETLQLYHFEDYRTSSNLWLATYRPPVIVFNNTLPSLKNVSLIGVNLPWASSPYLRNLRHLELALHPNNIRPPYEWWDKMLRSSPELKKLCLHYSGPKLQQTEEPSSIWRDVSSQKDKVQLEGLEELYLIDLDPDYLCDLMKRLIIPNVTKLHINLLDQDFTPFLDLITRSDEQDHDPQFDLDHDASGGSSSSFYSSPSPSSASSSFPFSFPSPSSPTSPSSSSSSPPSSSSSPSSPSSSPTGDGDIMTNSIITPLFNLAKLETLQLGGLECSPSTWLTFLGRLRGLKALDIDFARVPFDFRHPFMGVALEFTRQPSRLETYGFFGEEGKRTQPLLPRLERIRVSGMSGKDLEAWIRHRHAMVETHGATKPRWVVRWSEKRSGRDVELDELVSCGIWVHHGGEQTRIFVGTFDEDEGGGDGDEEGSEGGSVSGDSESEETEGSS